MTDSNSQIAAFFELKLFLLVNYFVSTAAFATNNNRLY